MGDRFWRRARWAAAMAGLLALLLMLAYAARAHGQSFQPSPAQRAPCLMMYMNFLAWRNDYMTNGWALPTHMLPQFELTCRSVVDACQLNPGPPCADLLDGFDGLLEEHGHPIANPNAGEPA